MLVFQGSIDNNIQSTKGVNIHHNTQTVIFIDVLHEIFSFIFKLIHSGNVYLIQRCPHSIKKGKFGKKHFKEAKQNRQSQLIKISEKLIKKMTSIIHFEPFFKFKFKLGRKLSLADS